MKKNHYCKLRLLIVTLLGGIAMNSLIPQAHAIMAPEMGALIKKAATEGIVLLKNEGHILPLKKDTKVAVFGITQIQTFISGYGSGGYVNPLYKYSILDGLQLYDPNSIQLDREVVKLYEDWNAKHPLPKDSGWGRWPYHPEEMPLPESVAQKAAEQSDTAIVVIGRAAGEDRECRLESGSYYLTDIEKDMIGNVTKSFKNTILVINAGNIVDMSWVEEYDFRAILYAWQGGMEMGTALADVLCGVVSPSGKLAETIAKRYEDYPSSKNFGGRTYNNYAEDIYVGYRYFETFAQDKVLYPFGFGLSYADFKLNVSPITIENGNLLIDCKVSLVNGPQCPAKEVVQIYCAAPQGKLGKPARSLVGFAKTPWLVPTFVGTGNYAPGGTSSCNLSFSIPLWTMASFDDSGKTGYPAAWVLEEGEYGIYVGTSVRNAVKAGSFIIEKTRVVEQLEHAAVIQSEQNAFDRFFPVLKDGKLTLSSERTPVNQIDMRQRVLNNLPKEVPFSGDNGIKLVDVALKKNTMNEFIAQLTPEELFALTRGDFSKDSKLGVKGNASVYAGVLPSLVEKGVPVISTADGPSGLWIPSKCSLLPIGSQLACTWNLDLIEKLYLSYGYEADANGIDAVLGPGMNIHRSVLCGRNFEYFSEDPLIAGLCGAAAVKGLQTAGISAVPKHYALNNQEVNRNNSDSRCSERAIREIYLRAFEICIKTGAPHNLMGSYNKINGEWSSYSYDISTTILRNEWHYKGCLMTDWWQQHCDSQLYYAKDNALRVRVQTDVLMPGEGPGQRNNSSLADSYQSWCDAGKPKDIQHGITLGELQRSALNVLNYALKSRTFVKKHNLINNYKPGFEWFSVLSQINTNK